MKKLDRTSIPKTSAYTERVLQFGGGNFLRAFTDWMIDVCNEKLNMDMGILLVTPIERDDYSAWQRQDGLYHVLTRGFQNGEIVDEKYLVKSISRILHLYPEWETFLKSAENPNMRFVISNTTEAGIRFSPDDEMTDTPPSEFPAKLCLWLYHRYRFFKGKKEAGCIFIPVELILKNGENLRKCILENANNWNLEKGFSSWINESNIFCNTLVDRIVPGISRDSLTDEMKKIGFEDSMMTQGEAFHFWVIEGSAEVQKELPLDKVGLNVIFTNDQTPYRTRKVRILNGAHTSMVPVGVLYGIETVRETVEDEVMGEFIRQIIFDEIIPSLDLPEEELTQYAKDVLDRFKNPFIRHELMSISLNSTSKFKTRVLPSILAYKNRTGLLPKGLVLSMAALIHFYKGEKDGVSIPLKDDAQAIRFLKTLWEECDGTLAGFEKMAKQVLAWQQNWGEDLSQDAMFIEELAAQLFFIERDGIKAALSRLLKFKI